MDEQTTLAQSLHVVNDEAKYDAACKRLLSEKVILAHIMKSCLEEYKDCRVDDIVEKYIEGIPHVSSVAVLPDEESCVIDGLDTTDKSIHEGTITYDIRFRALVPSTDDQIALIINVEAQNDFYPGYPLIKRGIYYCARMISSQYASEFSKSHYEKIKKVYSIWICTNPPKARENTITCYNLTEKNLVGEAKEPVANYDLLSVVMLCLGGRDKLNYDGIIRLLDVLLSNDVDETEKRNVLSGDYNIPMNQSIDQEVSTMSNLGQGVLAKGFAKGVAEGRAAGEAEGKAMGIVEGRAEGRVEGRTEGRIDSIKALMETLGLTLDQAMAALKIPESEKEKYINLVN